MDFNDWKKNETDFDIHGSKTYIGLDLSRADDLTAVSFIHLNEDSQQYYVTSHSFVATKVDWMEKLIGTLSIIDKLQKTVIVRLPIYKVELSIQTKF